MSRENVELAHQVIAAVEERNLASLIRLTDPQVEWRSAFVVGGGGGVYRGHDGMREYVNDMNDAWEVVRLDVDHELGVGDIVLFIGNPLSRQGQWGRSGVPVGLRAEVPCWQGASLQALP